MLMRPVLEQIERSASRGLAVFGRDPYAIGAIDRKIAEIQKDPAS
jgi:hypothetical protein